MRVAQFRAEQVGDKLKVAQFRRAGPPEVGKKVSYFKKYFYFVVYCLACSGYINIKPLKPKYNWDVKSVVQNS